MLLIINCFFLNHCTRPTELKTEETFTDSLPNFKGDAFWPKPLPDNWLLGQV